MTNFYDNPGKGGSYKKNPLKLFVSIIAITSYDYTNNVICHQRLREEFLIEPATLRMHNLREDDPWSFIVALALSCTPICISNFL